MTVAAPPRPGTESALDGIDEDDCCHIIIGTSTACGAPETCDHACHHPELAEACPGCGRLICEACRETLNGIIASGG